MESMARLTFLAASLVACAIGTAASAQERLIHTFQRERLTDEYYSEGLGAGDLDRDGHVDIVYGPVWFAGPDFKTRREIYPPKPQNKEGYADHFFAWIYDFNGDGWNDILTAGFPGTPGFVYENPKAEGHAGHWPKHQVIAKVSNESPQFTNLVGDERPELVCTKDGYFGYATFEPGKGFEEWTFHAISEKVAPVLFGHGLGVGDVDGDGRLDVLAQNGWFQQPKTLDEASKWDFHPARFAPIGGADMYAYDVDGDGDNDVITSLAAHDFGLAWYEQVREGEAISFREHLIMGHLPEQNRYGIVFSEPHSVMLADIDGDGLKDIITGKTYYSHHKASPMWDAGAVVYWFKLARSPQGVDWVPYKADGEAGIGRQLVVHDIDGDGLLDLASGGMKGAHVLLHRREAVSEERWRELSPRFTRLPRGRRCAGRNRRLTRRPDASPERSKAKRSAWRTSPPARPSLRRWLASRPVDGAAASSFSGTGDDPATASSSTWTSPTRELTTSSPPSRWRATWALSSSRSTTRPSANRSTSSTIPRFFPAASYGLARARSRPASTGSPSSSKGPTRRRRSFTWSASIIFASIRSKLCSHVRGSFIRRVRYCGSGLSPGTVRNSGPYNDRPNANRSSETPKQRSPERRRSGS